MNLLPIIYVLALFFVFFFPALVVSILAGSVVFIRLGRGWIGAFGATLTVMASFTALLFAVVGITGSDGAIYPPGVIVMFLLSILVVAFMAHLTSGSGQRKGHR